VNYISKVVLGERYEDIATGRIGTATAVNFKMCVDPTVQLEWRNGDTQKDAWFIEGRLREYSDVGSGEAL
jgi:hypothetical protein